MTPDAPVDTRACGKCGLNARLPRQRWCRRCLTAYKVARYWRLRAVTPRTWEPVTVTPVATVVEMPVSLCGLCGAHRWFAWTVHVWRCEVCGTAQPRA